MREMKLWIKNTILVFLLLLIIVIPLVFMGGSEFGGSDGQGADAVMEIEPDYEPWFQSLWEPPSGEIESLLFCVQAAAGAGIIGFVIGRVTSKRDKNNAD